MSIAAWNVRGFHKPNRNVEIWKMIGKYCISCFGILETKMSYLDILKLEKNLDKR